MVSFAVGATSKDDVGTRPRDGAKARPQGARVTIIRDEYGVPHLYADSLAPLFYGVGWAQGQDRLWQAETLRRAATGTLAEWFGAGSVSSDVQARTLFGPPSRRASLFASASPEVKVIFESFAAGMNGWIAEATATSQLPYEYAAFGVAPRTWTVDDSLAVYMLLGSRFGWFGSDELDNAMAYGDLVARLGPAEGARAFADTHWLEDPSAVTTDPAHGRPTRGHDAHGDGPRGSHDAAQAARQLRERQEEAEKALSQVGLRKTHMSNAIVLGPRMSADGKALLLGGPQMGYGAPQINHEMGLHGAGFEITGMQIAGWPLIPIGVGRGYAWSLTSGGSDNSDIFELELNPANPGQYRYRGDWRNLDCRVEAIPVAGQAPVSQVLCASVQGPVIAAAGGKAYAFQNTTFGSEMSTFEAWSSLGRVHNFAQFRKQLSRVAHNFNVLYADAEGTFAHFHLGRIPVRAPGANPFFPQPGDGSSDWQGTIPFEQMPHSVNPEVGWLTSWNNKPGPDWPNSSAGFWDWGPVHRVNTLRRILEQVPPHSATLGTLAAINRRAGFTTDSPSGSADTVIVSTMLGQMLGAVDASSDPRLPGAIALLRDWDWLQEDEDGDGAYDSPAVAVFNAWWDAVVASVLLPTLGPAADSTVCGNLIYRLLEGPRAALPVQADYLGSRTIGQALTSALQSALDSLAAQYGTPSMAAWLQERAEIAWVPGGIGSVSNTIWMNRGTYGQLVHLGKKDALRAVNVIAPGQSGDFRSPHFDDQLGLYSTWTYKPMRLTRDAQLEHAESVTTLTVP
jgi:penicillin G amidase